VLSIIVPVFNEEKSIGPLVAAVRDAMRPWRDDWEIVFIDDGSQDATVDAIEQRMHEEPRIRVIRLARNYGQSAAMQAGFDQSRGEIIVTMDGDLQNDPRDISALVAKLEEGFDLVAGYRERRQDLLLSRRIPSWFGNLVVRWVTGIPLRDTGCTLKAFRRELLQRLRLYSDLHRFIPALAVSIAGARITEIPVRHHARLFGRSKYGMSRVGKVLADLLTLVMLRRFREHPLAMFSAAALIALALAVVTSLLALLAAWDWVDSGSVVVLSAVAICWFTLAGFLVMAGLIAESTVHVERDTQPFDSMLLRRVEP
jgi:glycosyltransferase involved in cell wall biosynthesis